MQEIAVSENAYKSLADNGIVAIRKLFAAGCRLKTGDRVMVRGDGFPKPLIPAEVEFSGGMPVDLAMALLLDGKPPGDANANLILRKISK